MHAMAVLKVHSYLDFRLKFVAERINMRKSNIVRVSHSITN